MASDIPPGALRLTRGRHRSSDGACLMEATAVLTGQPFSDHPAGVHPLIAAVARIINDAVSDPARQRLLRYAANLAGTATSDPRVFDDLVVLICQRALPVALPLWAPPIRHALRQARRRRAGTQHPATGWQQRRAAAAVRYATASLALTSGTHRDDRLTALLADCLTVAHQARATNHPAVATVG
jgi:hypothetical protein